jgi:hypothetical protein
MREVILVGCVVHHFGRSGAGEGEGSGEGKGSKRLGRLCRAAGLLGGVVVERQWESVHGLGPT